MAQSVLGFISRKGSVGVSNWISRRAGVLCGFCSRISTFSAVSDESINFSSSLPSRISPWLMLPPAVDGENTVYKFYSIAENKVLSLNKRCGGGSSGGGEKKLDLPDDDAKLVGSSHGWLALFNERNCDLFLLNPLSGRHVKLPPINTLPIPEDNLDNGFGCVSEVIISCSPDVEEDCRAMINFGPEKRLAFCWPGRSTEWTPIGALFHVLEDEVTARSYETFVYSRKQKLFFCFTKYGEFEAWDLRDPRSPRLIPLDVSVERENYPVSEEELELKELCTNLTFLVVDDKSDQLFLVMRFIMERVDADGSYVEEIYYDSDRGFDHSYPYKTVGFDVHKYDSENRALRYMDAGSLDGLAFFIGLNHGFALSATEFPELKPNSIYFTDVLSPPVWVDRTYGGHDLGIFSYEDGTLSPCYYPCDVKSIKRIIPAPRWFTPSPL